MQKEFQKNLDDRQAGLRSFVPPIAPNRFNRIQDCAVVPFGNLKNLNKEKVLRSTCTITSERLYMEQP